MILLKFASQAWSISVDHECTLCESEEINALELMMKTLDTKNIKRVELLSVSIVILSSHNCSYFRNSLRVTSKMFNLETRKI